MASIKNTRDMISQMSPELREGTFVYCSTTVETLALQCAENAICMFQETEGRTFILPLADAERLGFDVSLPMRMITLSVHSALDGVGLTSAVAVTLSDASVPCNLVAAFYHDHVFVPAAMADNAMKALKARQGQTL